MPVLNDGDRKVFVLNGHGLEFKSLILLKEGPTPETVRLTVRLLHLAFIINAKVND